MVFQPLPVDRRYAAMWLRAFWGISQEDMAAKFGVSARTWIRLENGLDTEHADNVMRALGLALLGRDPFDVPWFRPKEILPEVTFVSFHRLEPPDSLATTFDEWLQALVWLNRLTGRFSSFRLVWGGWVRHYGPGLHSDFELKSREPSPNAFNKRRGMRGLMYPSTMCTVVGGSRR